MNRYICRLATYISSLILLGSSVSHAGINSFTASPENFYPGQSVTLSWSVTSGDVISISPTVGTVTGASGSVSIVPPSADTTYTLNNTTSGTTASVTVNVIKAASLKNRWSFNEGTGTTVIDSVSGLNGVIIPSITGFNYSRTSAAVSLPGGNSGTKAYIDLPNSIMDDLDEVTIEGWITPVGSTTRTWSRAFDFGTGSAGEVNGVGGSFSGTGYLFYCLQPNSSTTYKRIAIKGDNQGENYTDVTESLSPGTEYHFAYVYDADGNFGSPQVRYYKNGVLLSTTNTNFALNSITYLNNWLGRSNYSADANAQASYNEFRIWNRALSAERVADNSTAGANAFPATVSVESFTGFPSLTIEAGEAARLSYVIANPSGGSFTASIDQGVGTVTGTEGYVTVNPTATTTYVLSVTAGGVTRTANVTVTVIASSAPLAESLTVKVPYQTATAATLVANDYQTPTLSYSVLTSPLHGTLSGTAPNLTYTPAAGYVGGDSFTYQASDGVQLSNIATIALNVLPAPMAPTSITASESLIYTDYVSGSFVARLKAADGNPDDSFSYTLVSGTGDTNNSWFSISNNQLITNHNFSTDNGLTVSVRVRVTDSTANTFEQLLTFFVTVRPQTVVINEINYNPSRNTQASEYIELYNPTSAAIDLTSWRLASAVDYLFPVGTTIPAGGYLVIAENPAVIAGLYNVTALGPWSGGLSSQGENIELRNATGTVIDSADFGVSAPWPTLPNGDGPSLELVNPTFDNNHGGSWQSSTASLTSATYLSKGSSAWTYFKGTGEASSPTTAWRAEGFNDSTWLTGTMPIGVFKINSNTATSTNSETGVTLGTLLSDMATYSGSSFTTSYNSVFMRKTFTVSGTIPRALSLRVMHNDAAVVYINGTEVARFGFTPDAPTNLSYNFSGIYERANDPWSDILWLNPGTLLHEGTNTIAIHAFAKPPTPRSSQEDWGVYNIFDFCVDAELKTPTENIGTPGAQNSTYAVNASPIARDISHLPKAPKPWQPITVTARINDMQGLGNVQLAYQICTAGNYIPSTLPRTVSQILADSITPPPANPAFENLANWTYINMTDNGGLNDTAGDGIFTAVIPAQPHRTLIRYRIVATDLSSQVVTIPNASDPRKNFAAYSYNRVPNYTAGSNVFDSTKMESLPIYQLMLRPEDFTSLLAYNGADQFANSPALNVIEARHYENFVGTMIVGDQVMDHTTMRLRGGNSRYNGSGKRHFRFNFPKGNPLQAYNEKGKKYGAKWEALLFNKLFGNKGAYDFGLPYEVGTKLWSLQGVPMPEATFVHFRVVRNTNESDATNGDFWGLYQALELPEGKNFLAARNLPAGNFYKTTDWQQNGEMDQRYQASGAPEFGEDFDNIRYNIHQTTSQANVEKFINMPLWYKYNAVQEAVRHYDIFTEPTGRHRVKNLLWYFHPSTETNLGQLWYMPYDWDASFGANWNNGWDNTHNAIYDHNDIPDSPSWSLPKVDRSDMRIEHRNYIREFRDLVWYRDTSTSRGPFDDMIDDAMTTIANFYQADMARWPSNTGAQAHWAGGAPAKVADMKNFAFVGWTDPWGNGDPSVGAGGRATYLDSITDTIDSGLLPSTPSISYNGTPGYPLDGIALTSTAFADPQGAATFQAMQWRIGEITDATAPAYDPTDDRIYEVTPVWESGSLTTFNANVTVPGNVLRNGHTYRARVRHKDNTGRWGHWSAPLQFTTTGSNYVATLQQYLMISEFMYHPDVPTAAEAAAGFVEGDFEYIELLNISTSLTLDLTNVRFTKGIDFDFINASLTTLAPGQRVLIVKSQAAFLARYGMPPSPIIGVWDAADNLSNSGEQLKLSYGAGEAIHDFIYDDILPWPSAADTGPYSLVLISPYDAPNHGVATNWRASYTVKGTPGSSEYADYAEWAAYYGITDPSADTDCDGIANRLEYILSGDPLLTNTSIAPQLTSNGSSLIMQFLRHDGSEYAETLILQSGSDLQTWPLADEITIGATSNTTGTLPHGITYTITENNSDPDLIQVTLPINAPRMFFRLKTAW